MESVQMPQNRNADHFIDKLNLKAHPEGGYYRQTYCSDILINKALLPKGYSGGRPCLTAIYFLLKGDDFSALHRLKSDELWHYYAGSSLTIWVIHPKGELEKIILGTDIHAGETCQAIIPGGCWFGAAVNDTASFSLVGCTVSPGFHFDDFELGERAFLVQTYPEHKDIIHALTRV